MIIKEEKGRVLLCRKLPEYFFPSNYQGDKETLLEWRATRIKARPEEWIQASEPFVTRVNKKRKVLREIPDEEALAIILRAGPYRVVP